MPAEGFASVSVVCKDSGLGDVLSTALFCLPLDTGLKLVESMSEVEAMWVDGNGEKTVSVGFEKYVKEK
jgi:thiamine biosynthesis lipoprotein